MGKAEDNYTIAQVLWIIIKKIFYLITTLIRGTLFYIIKFLYKIFKLWEFEKEKNDVYMVKDNLTHSFNFKRSTRFKELYKDLNYKLEVELPITIRCDENNGTNDAEDEIEEIKEIVDELIVSAEAESIKKAFSFSSKRRNGIPYTTENEQEMSFYLENYMSGYGAESNDNLNTLKR